MNKIPIAFLCAGLAVSAALGAGQNEQHRSRRNDSRPIIVKVGDDQVQFPEAQPQAIMGRVMVPLRGIFERIGAYVEYNPATHVITTQYRNESIELVIGKRLANVNGAQIMMEVPAMTIHGSTLVPLRFLAESMGANVDFDADSNTVTISRTENSFVPKHDGHKHGGGNIPHSKN